MPQKMQMELTDILTIALASIIVLVVAHLAVFWVVKTLYPPATPVFTQPTVIQQPDVQHISIPTFEAPVPTEAPREEEQRRGPPPPEATSIHGSSGVDSTNTQPGEQSSSPI